MFTGFVDEKTPKDLVLWGSNLGSGVGRGIISKLESSM